MPFFSIIIPTYNRAGDLKSSLESVLQQSFTDFEVVVVDDGSTDHTAAVVRSFTDTRVKYIYQQNSERSAARNNGIRNASGKYICFLDSDDQYLPEHLAIINAAIEEQKLPVAMFKTRVQIINSAAGSVALPVISSKGDGVKYIWYNGCQLNSVCVHRDIAVQVSFPEEFFWFEDNHWALRVALRYPMHLIDRYTCTYNVRGTIDLLHKDYRKYEENCVACMRDLEGQNGDEIKRYLGSNCFNEKVAELYLGFLVAGGIATKQLKLAKKYLFKAMRICVTPKLMAKYVYYSLKLIKASFSK